MMMYTPTTVTNPSRPLVEWRVAISLAKSGETVAVSESERGGRGGRELHRSNFTPLLGGRHTTTTFHLPTCIRITRGIIKINIFTSPSPILLGTLLGLHTTIASHWPRLSLRCIRISWGIIKTQASDSFLEGFIVIDGRSHCCPHQN
jgi:hypothetical protein